MAGVPSADFRVPNHFGASGPRSAFGGRVLARRAHPDLPHLLDNRPLTTVSGGAGVCP